MLCATAAGKADSSSTAEWFFRSCECAFGNVAVAFGMEGREHRREGDFLLLLRLAKGQNGEVSTAAGYDTALPSGVLANGDNLVESFRSFALQSCVAKKLRSSEAAPHLLSLLWIPRAVPSMRDGVQVASNSSGYTTLRSSSMCVLTIAFLAATQVLSESPSTLQSLPFHRAILQLAYSRLHLLIQAIAQIIQTSLPSLRSFSFCGFELSRPLCVI